MAAISDELLDQLELYLNDRVGITLDGKPNEAMKLLIAIQAAREDDE